MNLSELPELREYRDDLAAKLGGSGRALEKANATVRRLYTAGVRVADAQSPDEGVSSRDIQKAVALVVAETRRVAGVTVAEGAKPPAKKKQRRDAAVGEAVKTAVDKVLAEAANGTPAQAATATPDSRPLHELSNDDLEARVTEQYATTAQQMTRRAGAIRTVAEAVMDPDDAPDGAALRKMSDDDFLSHLGGALGEQADRIRPPAGAIPSPFWAGLQ